MEGTSVEAFSGGERFTVLRSLGSGGMGVVYEAFDRQWNARVALKTLRAVGPEALIRLKNEFRAIQEIHHPNLVRLGELLEEQGVWLFTMELVEGVDFVKWSRRDGRPDEAQLRPALKQLVSALHAIHHAGKVHRDVKPSNVLVTADGRVVLLDFGLITRVAADDALTDGMIVGTAGYMAPEQAAGAPTGTAADWYAVGTLLYEALTGELPFRGTPVMQLTAKQANRAPEEPLRNAPPDLARLCLDLLQRDPDRRLDWHGLSQRLQIASEPADLTWETPFVGRRAELAELQRAFDDAQHGDNVSLFVHGESGIGKTALVDRFLRELVEKSPEVLLLQGQASHREVVPFNGFDGIVDGLARHLRERGGEIDVPDAGALVGMFPVLSRALGFGGQAPSEKPSLARRNRAFSAFGALLARLGRPVVLVIDDFQWADEDTVALRQALMRGPAAAILLIAVVRTSAETPAFLRRALLGEGGTEDVRHVFVTRLAEADSLELTRELLGHEDAAIAREAEGHPLFLSELARARRGRLLPANLHATIRARVQTLSPEGQRLVEVLAVGGGAIRQSIAAPAADLDAETYLKAVEETRAANLTRVIGAGLFAGIAAYHDQIAEAVLEEIPLERRRELHRTLAEVIEWAAGGTEPRTLFLHWLAAGDRERAARAAVQAAEEADGQLAFEQAAQYWRKAIELGGDRRTLLPRLACSLANGGRKHEAVSAYREAAALERDEARIENLRAAAEVLLHNGDIDEGVALLRQVLREIDMDWPRSQPAAVASLLLQRMRLRLRGLDWSPRPESSVPRRVLVRIDTAWSAAMALVMVDRARGADFQTRGLLLALDAGEPYRVARALILEAAFSAILDSRRARAQTDLLLTEGRRLAEKTAHPHALALIQAIEGIVQATRGQFHAGSQKIASAVPLLRASGTRWDVMHAEYLYLEHMALAGELRQLEQQIQALEREALAGQDRHTLANLRTGYVVLVRLLRDRPDETRVAVEEGMRGWSQQGFHRQHWFAVFALANIDLYQGRAADAHRRVAEAWKPLRRSLLLRSQLIRVGAINLRGRVALAVGDRRGAIEACEQLGREHVAWANGLSALLEAAIDPTPPAFLRAAELCEGADLRLHAAVARRRAGVVDPWWVEQGVVNPDGFVACFAPGGSR